MTDIKRLLGANIKIYRKSCNLTQAKLAEKKNTATNYISAIEIRRQKIMLDSDLATLYGVELRSLNQAVKRNIGRFPLDFMFQLTNGELNYYRPEQPY
ncbi:MAG: ORF6N domain-containing protein [Treponema sp.]|jgi:transcriptional regulator with XRE-family HTH domain|nr:ORF6N domain-containing protein [Treponema sp.]